MSCAVKQSTMWNRKDFITQFLFDRLISGCSVVLCSWRIGQPHLKRGWFVAWNLRNKSNVSDTKFIKLCYRRYIFSLIICNIWAWIFLICCAISLQKTTDLTGTKPKKRYGIIFVQQTVLIYSKTWNTDDNMNGTQWNSLNFYNITLKKNL